MSRHKGDFALAMETAGGLCGSDAPVLALVGIVAAAFVFAWFLVRRPFRHAEVVR